MNRYEQPAQQQFIDTYAALPFQEMAMLGNAYKQEREKTESALDAYKSQYGNFQSMSKKDIENWDQTIGVINPALEKMSANPEYIKSQEGQAEIRSLIRSVDTSKLNMLRTSADNLQKRSQVVAQMKASGRYNPEWDDVNIEQWDTLGSGKIMTDLSPIEYMNAAELSKQYFDNMQPGTLDSKWVDGVKYQVTGNNEADLRSIAMSKANDLIATPQGQKYYQQFLAKTGDPDKAAQQFQEMIVDANRDRIIRPKLDIDQAWLAQLKTSAKATEKINTPSMPEPDLYDLVTKSHTDKIKSRVGNDLNQYRDYIASLVTKYGTDNDISKAAVAGLKGIDKQFENINQETRIMQHAAQEASLYKNKYLQTNDENDLIQSQQLDYMAKMYKQSIDMRSASMLQRAQKPLIREEFKAAAGFDIEAVNNPKKFSHEGYMKGVKRVNSMLEFQLSDKVSSDVLIKNDNNIADVITDVNGSKNKAYQYNTSKDFLLPETVFQLQLGKGGRKVQRESGGFADSSFPIRELIESGKLSNVQFIPDNSYQRVVSNTGPQLLAKGKLRINKEQLRGIVGSGILRSGQGFGRDFMSGIGSAGIGLPFSKESVDSAMKRLYDASEVKEKVGDDGVAYYEMDIMKALPNEGEYVQTTKSLYKNTEGIGGAAHEKSVFPNEASRTMSTTGAK